MNLKYSLSILLLSLAYLTAYTQSPAGIWKTIDDETGEAKSHVEIYEKDGKYHGKIVKLLRVSSDKTCDNCPGAKKDKPLLGMEILWALSPDKDMWTKGKIMDPENGKTYKCKVWFEEGNGDELYVRGYIGISALGRNQTWYRVEE